MENQQKTAAVGTVGAASTTTKKGVKKAKMIQSVDDDDSFPP